MATEPPSRPEPYCGGSPPRWRLLALSIGCGTAMAAGLWFGYQTWQFVAWLASLALLTAALWNSRWDRPDGEREDREPWTIPEFLTLALIVGAGIYFRAYQLDVLPPGLWIDECNVTTRAVQLMEEKPFLPFGCLPLTWLGDWVQTSNLYLYSIVIIFKLFGYSYYTIKMTSILPGIIGVPALYLFCRELAGKRTAICAGVLFAVGHWNVRLSRWGWDEVAMTTLQIVSYYFLVRGLRRRRRRDFVWAGIFMGLCLYTYIASRLALLAALLCLGVYAMARGRGWRRRLVPMIDFGLATLLTVAPLAIFYIQNPRLFSVRTDQVSILARVQEAGSLRPLWDNLVRYLLMFHVSGDVFAKHDLPHAPLLDPVTGTLFVLGLVMVILRWRSPAYLLCGCWLWIGLLAGVLSQNFNFPHAYRTGNVAPAAVAMAALPLGWALSWANRPGRWARLATGAASVLVASLIGAAVWFNYKNYFVEYAHLPALWDEMMVARGTNVARYLLKEARGRSVYVSRWATDAGFSTVLRRDVDPTEVAVKNWNPDYWNPDTNPPLDDASRSVLFFGPPTWKQWITGWYPHTNWQELRNMYGDVYCAVADIPAQDIAAVHGLARRVIGSADAGAPAEDGVTLADIGVPQGPGTLFEGYFYQRLPGFGTFGVPDHDVLGIWLDEQRILEAGQAVSREVAIAPGLHPIRVLLSGDRAAMPRLVHRGRWTHGNEVPVDNLSPAAGGVEHGLRGQIFAGSTWQGEPLRGIAAANPSVILADRPPVPYSEKWDGYLRVDQPGSYVIGAAMDDGGTVAVDGRQVLAAVNGYAEGAVELSAGEHAIEIRHYETGGGSYQALFWIPPNALEVVADGEWAQRGFAPLDPNALYQLPFAGMGLRARYFDGEHFDGQPFLVVTEAGNWISHHKQAERFSVELEGDLYFPNTGTYTLGLNSDDGSWLYLDHQLVIDNGGVHGYGPVSATVNVKGGRHHIRVRYFQAVGGFGLHILWAPQGETLEDIPPVFMYPAG